ncbi:hypothetical protein IC580_02295 [Cupriavidus sp. ISTL7]|uniref:Uncharacterized protein n=2 Tax=Pseudomonadota TaxID=1224 RepID=A0ABY4VR45_9BURK|nr:hypothetical protein [Cupriavidus gilardii]QQE07297.1 hypothetical protein IC580_02295 [Cupriavidus sp. ISTL7]USE79657.1 hypothetical protein NDR89_24070 [Cupriavidus gilardii]
MPSLSAPAITTILFPSLTSGGRHHVGDRTGPSSPEVPIDTLAQAEGAIGGAVTADCAQHLQQLKRTIDALAIPASQKQPLRKTLEECGKDLEALLNTARDIVQLEHRATMPWEAGAQAQQRHTAVVMARNLKLATQCQALMHKLQSLQDEIAPHVQKRSIGKIIALAVGALLGIAGAATLAVILWPVAVTGVALGGSFLLTAACAAGTGASAAVGVIATIFGAAEVFARPEAYRHFPDQQPDLARLIDELGNRMSRWLEANPGFSAPLPPDVLTELCGGDIGAFHFCAAVRDSKLCDAAKRLVDHGSERAPAQGGLARTVSSRLISPDPSADDAPDDVVDNDDSDWDEVLDHDQMIEQLWHRLGFERKNPSGTAERPADAAPVDMPVDMPVDTAVDTPVDTSADNGSDPASDRRLSRTVSTSTIGSYNSVDMEEGPDGLGDPSAYGLGIGDSASQTLHDTVQVVDDAGAPGTSAVQSVQAVQVPPIDVRPQWEASRAWAESRIRTAARYVQHLSTALAQPYPNRIEGAGNKEEVMVEALCAFQLLEKVRSEMLALEEMGGLHAGRFATARAMNQLAVTMSMERGWFLGNHVTGLRALFDDGNSLRFDDLPSPTERAEASQVWNAAIAEAGALVRQLDDVCASVFQRTFRGLTLERAMRFFARPIASRAAIMERELRQDPPTAQSPSPSL